MNILRKLQNVANIMSLGGLVLLAIAGDSRAADISFLCAGALQSAMQELLPDFEKATGNNVKVAYTNIGTITARVRQGDQADLVIISPQQWEQLQKEGRLDAVTRVIIGKVGLGVSIKKGSARPDISTVDALKRMLLAARAIAVSDPNKGSPVAAYVIPLFDRLGLASDIKPKLRFTAPGPGQTAEALAKGEADIAFDQVTDIIASSEVDLVGLLPSEIQNFTVYTAAIPITANQPAAAKALIDFLTSPRAVAVLKSTGLEPD